LTEHQKAVEEAAGMNIDRGMANAATVAAAPATRETVLRAATQSFVDHVTENGNLDTAPSLDGCIGLAAWVGGCGECLKRFDAMRAALAADESTPTVETRDAKL
jgi:hypothetical protein